MKTEKVIGTFTNQNRTAKTTTIHTQAHLLQHLTIHQTERKQRKSLQSTKTTDIGHRSN
jgi:hypothetical protein